MCADFKRVLIVSPHFPPTNAADHQRVRLVLPYLQECGWQAEVLAVEASGVASPRDEWLITGLPAEVRVHRVPALGLGWSRIPGLGTLTFRALGALRRKGDDLLGNKAESGKWKAESGKRRSEFDLVYFSTTQFGVHGLGPRWQQQFGIPFVMDYQDPWVSDYYRNHPQVTPPGGRLKYALADWLNRRQEPRVLRHCAGITSVSEDYLRQLKMRYEWLNIQNWESGKQIVEIADTSSGLRPPSPQRGVGMEEAESRNKTTGRRDDETTDRKTTGRQDNETARQAVSGQSSAVRGPTSDLRPSTSGPKVRSQLSVVSSPLLATVLPFPGDERDLARVAADGTRQDIFSPGDGKQHWVYVGRGGNDMHLAVSALFLALAEALGQQPALRNRLQLHFIGTSYAAAGHGQKSIQPIAEEFGLQNVVIEHTDRIPYSQTLRCLLDADALIVPGSDDPGYTASKIYPYLLAGKPLLAVFHENSSVVSLLQKVGGGVCVTFKTGEPAEEIAKRILESRWLGPKAEKLKTEGRNKTTEHRTTGLQTTDHGPPTSDLRPPAIPLDRAAFEPHTARAQARVLAEFFNQILKRDH